MNQALYYVSWAFGDKETSIEQGKFSPVNSNEVDGRWYDAEAGIQVLRKYLFDSEIEAMDLIIERGKKLVETYETKLEEAQHDLYFWTSKKHKLTNPEAYQ